MNTLDHPNQGISEQEVSFWPTVSRYAMIGSLAMVAYTMLGNLTGLNVPTSFGKMALSFVLSLGISIAVAVLPVRHHRDNELGGYISFGRALLVGFLVLLIAALVNAGFQYFYVSVIDPGYLENMGVQMAEFYAGMGLPEEALEQMVAEFEKMTPGTTLKQGLIGGGAVSLILALIVAAIMKKKPVEY